MLSGKKLINILGFTRDKYASCQRTIMCLCASTRRGLSKLIFVNPGFNSLSNDKILGWSKSKAFADDKINAIK